MTGRQIVLILALLGAAAVPVSAHDLGTTYVTADFRADGTYHIDIAVDPDALLIRLELARGGEIPAGLSASERDRLIAALAGVFLEGVEVGFDGVEDRPRFEYLPATPGADTAQTPGLVRLRGTTPNGAQAWVFNDGFAAGWFAVETRADGTPARMDWLEGGKRGRPVPLRARSRIAPIFWRALPVVALGAVLVMRYHVAVPAGRRQWR